LLSKLVHDNITIENALIEYHLAIIHKYLIIIYKYPEGSKMKQTRLTWFIISSVLGILFIIWGAIAFNPEPAIPKLIPGDIWLILPGILMLFLGLFGIFEDYLADRKIIRYLSSKEANSKTIQEISEHLDIEVKILGELIFKLQLTGKLMKVIDTNTGVLKPFDSQISLTCTECAYPYVTSKHCPVCGTEMLTPLPQGKIAKNKK